MSVADRFRAILRDPIGRPNALPVRAADPAPASAPAVSNGGALAGGRLSYDDATPFLGGLKYILPPADAESAWRLADLDAGALGRMSPARLLELLVDLSPDVSRALWDYLRLLNPGWECRALTLDTGKDEVDPRGQAALDGFLGRLSDLYGSADVVWGRLNLGMLMRGALMAELVLDETGRFPVDFATPDPASVRFERWPDPVRGTVWVMGQWQATGFVPLDRPTLRYLPVDPLPGKPYGRAPLAPALHPTLFLLGLMHDLRRVVAQQGYPRLDIEVDFAAMLAAMPDVDKSDPVQVDAWLNDMLSSMQAKFSSLQPDDAYFHLNIVKVNRPVGAVDGNFISGISGVIDALERMAMRALKTLPIFMGITEGASEAASNRQVELFMTGIRSMQHHSETLIERLLTLGLQAQGIQARVEMRFAELRKAEMQRDALTDTTRYANALAAYLNGWTSQDEAANAAVGHDSDQDKPRVLPKADAVIDPGVTEAAGSAKPDVGADRVTVLRRPGKSREMNAREDVSSFADGR